MRGGALTSKYSDEIAIKTGDKSSFVKINELWSSEAEVFNTTNLRKLLNYITNSSNTGETNSEVLSSIKTTLNSGAITASDIRASTYGNKTNSQSVVVRLGGLDWIVTYVSTDTEGNVIATLWLSNNVQDTFKNRSQTEGELYGYLDGGLYSDWSDDWYYDSGNSWEMPSNMYGTSYIRAVTLNNGGTYASYTGNNPGEVTDSSLIKSETAIKNSASAFAPFTMGALTNYIVKPSAVSWQKEQSAVTTLSGWTSVKCPNDEWQTSSSGYYTDSQGRNYNYSSLANYSAWNADNIWLPSITETGYSENTNRTGLWALSNTERMTYDGSTTSNLSTSKIGNENEANIGAYAYSWLRSGYYYNSLRSYLLNPSGANYYFNHVNFSYAVRPALHLNLTKALEREQNADVWDGDYSRVSGKTAAEVGFEGNGTETSPYIVDSADKLAWISENSNISSMYDFVNNKHYRQTVDINLNNEAFKRISGRTYFYDGKSYVIYNMSITYSETAVDVNARAGLFEVLTDGSVLKDLTICSGRISANHQTPGNVITPTISIGVFVAEGWGSNKITITNCHSMGITFSAFSVVENMNINTGGISGSTSNSFRIENCTSNNDISIDGGSFNNSIRCGGIAGKIRDGTIINCKNYGAIKVSSSVTSDNGLSAAGGIVGIPQGSRVFYCENYGNVEAEGCAGVYSGGVCGQFTDYISQASRCVSSSNFGNVVARNSTTNNQGSVYAGGVCGVAYSPNLGDKIVLNCYNLGNVYASHYVASRMRASGVASNSYRGALQNCYNAGYVRGSSNADEFITGIAWVYRAEGEVINCYADSTNLSKGADDYPSSYPATKAVGFKTDGASNAVLLETSQMKSTADNTAPEGITGFDTNVWIFEKGCYPKLQSLTQSSDKIDISNAETNDFEKTYTYTTYAIQPEITTVTLNGETLIEYVDYVAYYSGNVGATTSAKVVILGIGEYTGEKVILFTINPKNITDSDMLFTLDESATPFTYDGKSHTPTFTLKYGDYQLIDNGINPRNYLLRYATTSTATTGTLNAPINAGNYYMLICGNGSFTGIIRVQFEIKKVEVTMPTLKAGKSLSHTFTGAEVKIDETWFDNFDSDLMQLVVGDDYTYSATNAGTYKIRIELKDKTNYKWKG